MGPRFIPSDPGGVDPRAWTVLEAHAIRSRKALAAVVGKLVVQSFARWRCCCRSRPRAGRLHHTPVRSDDSPACSSTMKTGCVSANAPPETV